MVKKSIVVARDYNGYKNVLFMMRSDDFRYNSNEHGYTVVEDGEFDKSCREFRTTDGKVYQIYSDWSAQLKSIN